MRSIARILPVLVFVGRVALASPIVVGRDDSLVVCTYMMGTGDTGSISQNDLRAFRAGEKTGIPEAALNECSQRESSGEGSSLRAGGQSDGQPTPPPAPSNNNDVQLDESTQGNNKPSDLSPPSTPSQDEDVDGGVGSSSNSPNDDNTKPSATDGEVDSSGSPLRLSSNSPNADDNTTPSETSSKSPLRSSSNSPNAGIKADDNTTPSETSSKSPLRSSSDSSNAADNMKPSATVGEVDSSKSPLRSSSNSDENTEGEADLLNKVSNLAEGANRAQVKGKAANKAPAAGDSDSARVGMEDCTCRKP